MPKSHLQLKIHPRFTMSAGLKGAYEVMSDGCGAFIKFLERTIQSKLLVALNAVDTGTVSFHAPEDATIPFSHTLQPSPAGDEWRYLGLR